MQPKNATTQDTSDVMWGLQGVGWCALAAALVGIMACGGRVEDVAPEDDSSPPVLGLPPIFVDGSDASGLDVVHFNGMSGELYLREITCGGGGWLDADGDGDLDLYLVQGSMLGPGKSLADALIPPAGSRPVADRLLRNGGRGDDGAVGFTDISHVLDPLPSTYGCSMAAADFDNDGWTDIFLANLGINQLFRHGGLDADGLPIFHDVAAAAGLDGDGMSTVAAAFDYDRDGWLDLFVGGYVTFDESGATRCSSLSGAPDYCGPGAYPSEPDRLYRNLGDGTFEDVSERVGLHSTQARPALGAAVADFNGDGWLDLYVANDGEPNHLWISRRRDSSDGAADVIFSEEALLAGSAVNAGGAAEAGMGVDVADFDDDGDVDIFIAHLIKETNTLYLNDGAAVFRDHTAAAGLGSASLPRTSFGVGWLDYDNDGWLDLLVASGGVVLDPELVVLGDPFPLHMPNQLFRNEGGATGEGIRFVDVTAAAGEALALSEVSRGVAIGDVDNDGDADALVFNNGGRLRLLVNQVGQDRDWLGLRLVTGDPPRDALHAGATLRRNGRLEGWRQAHGDGSYNVSRDPRILWGLGEGAPVDGVRVVWVDGQIEEWDDLETGRYHTLQQGEGRTVEVVN